MLPPVLLTGAKWFAQVHPRSTAAQYYLFISPIEILPSPAEGFKAATFWSQVFFLLLSFWLMEAAQFEFICKMQEIQENILIKHLEKKG